jgi:Xaa-Pro aminopeptidase
MKRQRMHKEQPSKELTGDELAAETAVDLPDREAMSTFGHGFGHGVDHDWGNFAMPINTAEASNVESTSSVAAADADQTVIIFQRSDD